MINLSVYGWKVLSLRDIWLRRNPLHSVSVLNNTIVFHFLVIVVGLFFSFTATAQTQMVYDTIPFEIIKGKFVFTAKIDGKPARFILDTGGQNIMTAENAAEYGVEILRSQTIADANDAMIHVRMGAVKNLKIGKWMNWDVGKMTVVPNNRFFQELGVVGAIGGEAFGSICLSIDRRNQYFTVSYPFRPRGISRNDGTPMEMGNSFHAITPITVGSEHINILFDTGMSGFLSLSAKDFEKINKQKGNVEKRYTGHGILFVGVAGLENAISDSIFTVRIPVMTIPGGKQLHNVNSFVGQQSTTVFGQKLFDYGVVMLDYPRGLFYFFPYENEPSDVDAVTKAWNVRILPIIDHFEVVATIGDVDMRVGERVWNINGTDLTLENFSETFVLALLDDTERDTADLIVGENENQLRKVIIKKI